MEAINRLWYNTGEPLKGLAFALKRRARASARLAFAPTRARRRGRGDRRAIEKSFQSLVGIRGRAGSSPAMTTV